MWFNYWIKKKKRKNYDKWELKKKSIDYKTKIITTSIENGIVDFEEYKKQIKSQYVWENKLLIFVEKDKTINENEKKIIKERVNLRKQIIEKELIQKLEE